MRDRNRERYYISKELTTIQTVPLGTWQRRCQALFFQNHVDLLLQFSFKKADLNVDSIQCILFQMTLYLKSMIYFRTYSE